MATDFNKPVVTDAYATLLPGLVTANKDLARMLDPALTGSHTNLPDGTVQWSSANSRWQRWNGTSWTVLAASYAISISGNAATATKLATARTIGGVSFDGSANINLPGVNAQGSQNTTGNAATATLATKASTLSQGGANGTAMTFNWSGQPGQPSWLWGSDDGSSINVYNPSNFSVNYANTAGNGGVTSVNGMTGAVNVASTPTTANVGAATAGMGLGAVGSYALIGNTTGAFNSGEVYTGMKYVSVYEFTSGAMYVSVGSTAPGTWRVMSNSISGGIAKVGLGLRIA